MVKNLLAAFDKRVDSLEWMAPATKAQAKAKIKTLRVGVGYPETWRDYKGLVIRPDDPVGNAWRAKEWEYKDQISKLGRRMRSHPTYRDWQTIPEQAPPPSKSFHGARSSPRAGSISYVKLELTIVVRAETCSRNMLSR